jgi:hypothetical protein
MLISKHLEAKVKENVYFIDFGDMEGLLMIIYKALHGLRTSRARFHERLVDDLRAEGCTA